MDTMVDLAAIQALLDTASRVRPTPAVGVQDSLEELSGYVQKCLTKKVSQRSETSPTFNLLNITQRAHYEVTTHSAILAQLLNPLGTHEQGGLFLSAFLQRIVDKKPQWHFPTPDTRWLVQKERDYIDIRLIHPSALTQT
jgi:hypothetical protein